MELVKNQSAKNRDYNRKQKKPHNCGYERTQKDQEDLPTNRDAEMEVSLDTIESVFHE